MSAYYMIDPYYYELPFATKKEINNWAKRYSENQTGAQKLVEEYLIGLKKTVKARKTPEAPRGYLLYDELYDLVYWKLKRSRWIHKNSEAFVKDVTSEAFRLDDDWEKLKKLKALHGVRESVASAILHLCDQKEYPILDQHALRSVLIDHNEVRYESQFWQKYVDFCRAEAERFDVSMRTLDRALWKYSEVGIRENDELRRRSYPQTGGPLGVTMPSGEQIRRRYGVDTYIEAIEKIGVEEVKNLYLRHGKFLLIRSSQDELSDILNGNIGGIWQQSGVYEIKNPGAIYRQGNLLKEIAKRLNIDLIVDYFD